MFAVRCPVPYCIMHPVLPSTHPGDMHPDDATGNVYRWLRVHISRPPSVSVRIDAASACIGKRGKSRNRYPQGEWLFMRRDVIGLTPLRTGSISKAAVSGGLLSS